MSSVQAVECAATSNLRRPKQKNKSDGQASFSNPEEGVGAMFVIGM